MSKSASGNYVHPSQGYFPYGINSTSRRIQGRQGNYSSRPADMHSLPPSLQQPPKVSSPIAHNSNAKSLSQFNTQDFQISLIIIKKQER